MKNNSRNFKTIYFPLRDKNNKLIIKNVCIAFNKTDEKLLYERIKNITSSDMKKITGIHSYSQLTDIAQKENRKITEIIKLKLADNLLNISKVKKKYIEYQETKLKKWIKSFKTLNAESNKKELNELIVFLNNILEKN